MLLSREVSYLLAGSEYWEGINIIPILTMSIYFTFMYQFPVNFEFFHRKTKIVAIGTVGASVVNIILNAYMIPSFGMYGAAIATMFSYIALFVVHYFIVTYVMKEKYHLKVNVFFPFLMLIGVAIIFFYVFRNFWYIRWGMGVLLGIYEVRKILNRKVIF